MNLAWLAARLPDALVSALAITLAAALGMALCRQPARRRFLARVTLVALLGVWPLVALDTRPRLDLAALSWSLARPLDGPPILALRTPEPPPAPAPMRPVDRAARLAALLYLGVAALGLGRLVLAAAAARRCIRRSTPAPAPALSRLAALDPSGSCRGRLGESAQLWRPSLVGCVRPWILLPAGLLDRATDAQLDMVLAHELAHARARDPLFRGLAELAQAVWWLLPPLGRIVRQMNLDQEYLADRSALDHLGGTPAQYTSNLVGLAGGGREESAPRAGPRPAASHSSPAPGAFQALLPRALMLLKAPYVVRREAGPLWRAGATFALIALLAAAGRVTVVPGPLVSRAGPADRETPAPVRIDALRVEPGAEPGGFILPAAATADYRLTLEVFLEHPAALPRHRFDGLRLEPPADLALDRPAETASPPPGPGGWARIEIDCRPGTTRATVQGRPVPARRDQPPTRDGLELRPPPGRVGLYRAVVLEMSPVRAGS